MVKCGCGKIIDKVPKWLEGVNATFVCTNCPDRQIKNITQVTLTPPEPVKSAGADLAAVDELVNDDPEDDI